MDDEKGVWCIRLKKIPTAKQAKRCRYFCCINILNDVEEEDAGNSG